MIYLENYLVLAFVYVWILIGNLLDLKKKNHLVALPSRNLIHLAAAKTSVKTFPSTTAGAILLVPAAVHGICRLPPFDGSLPCVDLESPFQLLREEVLVMSIAACWFL
jgi:hypothetical protein